MSRSTEFLEAHKSSTPSRWREDAQWRRENEFWLRYSQSITLRVLRAMDDQSVTQAMLARRMGCTQQYVSNLLKGSSNMTLETIGRLEKALNLDILHSAFNHVGGYDTTFNSRHQYLTEPSSTADTVTKGTAGHVEGYAKKEH